MKNEEDEPAPVDLYAVPKLPNTLKMFEGGIALLQNLDDNCECGLLMGRDIYFAVVPFNVMLERTAKSLDNQQLCGFPVGTRALFKLLFGQPFRQVTHPVSRGLQVQRALLQWILVSKV
jgi:hypothetical protein